VAVDRLGSVRWATMASHTYYPYGVEYTATANDMEKYATYTRDTLTGLDYAVNRYYASIWGRFISPDPSWSSADLRNPQSWNRYAYTLNDPINGNDPSGLDLADDGGDWFDIFGSGGGGGGDPLTGSVVTDIPAGSGYLNPSAIGIPQVTSTFTAVTDPTATLPNGDMPIWGSNGGNGQQIVQQVGQNPAIQNFGTALGEFAGASLVGGAIVASSLATTGGLAAVSTNSGDGWLLPQNVANTFTNGFATQVTATEEIPVQRVFSSNMLGQYWTTTPITSASQATNVLALGAWNTATNLVNGLILPGTTFFLGNVGGNLFGSGGAVQIVVNPVCVAIVGAPCHLH
jgi:RHS repeat-associated protein